LAESVSVICVYCAFKRGSRNSLRLEWARQVGCEACVVSAYNDSKLLIYWYVNVTNLV